MSRDIARVGRRVLEKEYSATYVLGYNGPGRNPVAEPADVDGARLPQVVIGRVTVPSSYHPRNGRVDTDDFEDVYKLFCAAVKRHNKNHQSWYAKLQNIVWGRYDKWMNTAKTYDQGVAVLSRAIKDSSLARQFLRDNGVVFEVD